MSIIYYPIILLKFSRKNFHLNTELRAIQYDYKY